MKAGRSGDARSRAARLVSALCLASSVFLAAAPVSAADRTVLCEEFTDVWCYGCGYAGPALSRLVDVYPDSFAFVQLHAADEYATQWAIDRWAFYDGHFTPLAVFDGLDAVEGAVSNVDQQYTTYRANHFLPDREIPTDVTLSLDAEDLGGQTYRVTAEVGIEAGGTGKTMTIHVVQVLDHWPADKDYHRNTFKQAAATQDVILAPGQTQVVDSTFTFDADSWAAQEDIKIVAWAQVPVGAGAPQVHQAAVRLWPLISYPGDRDGDGELDGEDNCPDRFNPTQDDADGDNIGDVCDNCPDTSNADQLDADDDGYGDACDNCVVLHHVDQSDTDVDSVGDVCDACPEVDSPAGVNQFGESLGTIDLDCDVDFDDVGLFAQCMAGPQTATPPPACVADHFTRCDTDADVDVDLGDYAVLAENFTGPLVSPPRFVGADTCLACHAENHASWITTIHATAFDTLVASGDGDNYLCFPCHSVGYAEPSGFVDLPTTPHLANVQCENCHGPGSNHVGDPNNVALDLRYGGETCGACHQSCHGLCGEDHHPQFEQWSISQHSEALLTIMFHPDLEDACLECHSTDYRLAPEGNKPGTGDVSYSVECVACHDPHGSLNVGQLRLPPNQLCADCHTMQSAVPGDEPHQPQSEVLHSTGGYELDGTPLAGPYTEHWWGIPGECAQCHVYMEPYGGPEQPVNSGHTFTANMRACEPCHSEAVATTLVQMASEEITQRLAVAAPYFTPGDALYIDPNSVPPAEMQPYLVAKFNFALAGADRSAGSHNAPYTRALLAETEEYLDLPPWAAPPPPSPGGGLPPLAMPTPDQPVEVGP